MQGHHKIKRPFFCSTFSLLNALVSVVPLLITLHLISLSSVSLSQDPAFPLINSRVFMISSISFATLLTISHIITAYAFFKQKKWTPLSQGSVVFFSIGLCILLYFLLKDFFPIGYVLMAGVNVIALLYTLLRKKDFSKNPV